MKYKVWFALLLLAAGCRTKERPGAGKGGNAAITVFPQHHSVSKNLATMKVYIKYNTSEQPGDGRYDDSMACITTSGVSSCVFTGLKTGNYYFAATGYDTLYKQPVKGGIPYQITTETSQTLNLPVSEDH